MILVLRSKHLPNLPHVGSSPAHHRLKAALETHRNQRADVTAMVHMDCLCQCQSNNTPQLKILRPLSFVSQKLEAEA